MKGEGNCGEFSILRYQSKIIEGPFGSENEYYYTMILGDIEDFETNLVCSNPSCDWNGIPSEAKAQKVEKGSFFGVYSTSLP